MTFGTAPQAIVSTLATNWSATRTGRPDIPDVPRDGSGNALTGSDAKRKETGTVLIARDREIVADQHSVHDLVHAYHPQATGISFEDKGYNEQGTTETVQIDIEVTDRRDPSDGTRTSADVRLVGDRSDSDFSTDLAEGPYPGILGEVLFILEKHTRKGFNEYDKVSKDVVNLFLGNSNASASVQVDPELLSINTA